MVRVYFVFNLLLILKSNIFVKSNLQFQAMNDSIRNKLAALREVMGRERLDAFIFPSTDPHCGEYVPDHWKGREWISGFGGSAGTAVVTMDAAALWTDSRYFIAAGEALRGTGYELMRERVDGTPTIAEWLGRKLATAERAEVGIDGMAVAASEVESLTAELRAQGGITLRTNFDPLDRIWADRPPMPDAPVELYPETLAGEPARAKLERIRAGLRSLHADGMLLSSLDDIAWALNLRGSDVHCNPVFVSYLLMEGPRTTLFIDRGKLTEPVCRYLDSIGVGTAPYGTVAAALRSYSEYNILMDPGATCHTLYKAVGRAGVVAQPSPVAAMKAVKNATEQEGFRRAILRDGVALVRFLRWLKPAVEAGGQTELSVSRKLESLRAAQPLYRGLSFDTISAYQAHGAIVHYEPTPATDAPLRPEGLLLIDSGAQYLDGTTDVTRTIALGPVTGEQRRVYTLVLKAHIALSRAVFPCGASGTQIDALAREPLWREGLNYLHGTGHGVGCYLNVHEGPHQIRMEWKPAPLLPGMTVTDEPGIYVEGSFGVRTENTLLIVPHGETAFGRFLAFEPLTLCPIDRRPIVAEMLDGAEREWLNGYHATVYERLSPLLEADEREWLADACAPV